MSAKVLALIPAYNEAARIGGVVEETKLHVTEVVVIDDGSNDNTAEVARNAGAQVVIHAQNQGKGGAILTGLNYMRESDAEYAVLLDADGQHDPSELPKFVEKAELTGADIVVGTRMADVERMPRVRLWTNQFTSWVTGRLARQRVPDSQCGYRLVRRTVLPDLKFSTARFETETEMLIQAGRAGHLIENVPIRTIYLAGRQSHIHPLRDTIRFFKLAAKYWRTGQSSSEPSNLPPA
jgi:glycosyltransferase involved in cell wall biosynthesis